VAGGGWRRGRGWGNRKHRVGKSAIRSPRAAVYSTSQTGGLFLKVAFTPKGFLASPGSFVFQLIGYNLLLAIQMLEQRVINSRVSAGIFNSRMKHVNSGLLAVTDIFS
jgi:hypothetical protein